MHRSITDRIGAWRPRDAALPVVLAAAAVTVAVYIVPGLTGCLQYERVLVGRGEWWRLLTSHWTHWTGEHLLWDLVVFAVLLFHSLRISVRRTLGILAATSLAIPVTIWVCLPDMETYRGLSGLDSGLFVFVACMFLRESTRRKHRLSQRLLGGFLVGFAAKVGFEVVTGHTVFVRSMGTGVTGVPLAHLTGALVGIGAAGHRTRPYSTASRYGAGRH